MKTFQIRPVNKDDKAWVAKFHAEQWGSAVSVTRGKAYQADKFPGFIGMNQDRKAGLALYRVDGKECEIMSMNSLVEGIGIGSALVDAIKNMAVQAGCRRLWLITTNDNTKAIRFWQKRGFKLAAVYPGSVEKLRELKPEIPLIGDDGIPIRDEIELEMFL
jgi:GNAT superfamily N-acetyltransferase